MELTKLPKDLRNRMVHQSEMPIQKIITMKREVQDSILDRCERIKTIVENNQDRLSSDDLEDMDYFVTHIENMIWLDIVKEDLVKSKLENLPF